MQINLSIAEQGMIRAARGQGLHVGGTLRRKVAIMPRVHTVNTGLSYKLGDSVDAEGLEYNLLKDAQLVRSRAGV